MQEESRIQSLKGEIEGSVYVTKGYRQPVQNQGQYPRNGSKIDPDRGVKNDYVCSYCKKTRHLKDKCWQLHGKPPHLAKAHAVQNSQAGGGSTSNYDNIPSAQDFQKMMLELQHLKSLFNSSSTVIGSTSMANSGKNEIFFSLTFLTKNLTTAWILDSGGTNHMTPLSQIFVSYKLIAPGKHVQTADGTLLFCNRNWYY